MDVLSPLLHVVFRSLVVLFPLTVGWLAFRRLAISKSGNAWTYAAMCLFAAVNAAGVLPWALGITPMNWFLTLLALFCPLLWISVLLICDVSRSHRYGPDPLVNAARAVFERSSPRVAPLELTSEPSENALIKPMFRHRAKDKPKLRQKTPPATNTHAILTLARDIRGNQTSDRRRPKLLPSPKGTELPFLKRSRDT